MFAFRKLMNLVAAAVEKRRVRPYCKSQQKRTPPLLPFPELEARLRNAQKEIGNGS
jgi:hypothetical protein